MRGANNTTMDTINAAATAIASADNRLPHASSVQKRRWASCWSLTWCFGSQSQRKRIGHAVLFPEPSHSGAEAPSRIERPTQQPPSIVLPFIAPPSSPASFLQSEPPSATQSPTGLISFTSISANMYSPGPPSMFTIGPYAHETQLVSPPVFSTFNTEPSTAPFTPPPESVHLTTPSSPEVPFARLLDPTNQNGGASQRFPLSHYEFQSYQLYPGSPVGQLISPSSGISGSGTSSPFPDIDFARGGPHFLEFPIAASSKLDKLAAREWDSRQGSGTMTPDALVPGSRDGPHVLEFSVAADYKSDKLAPSERESQQVSGSMTPDAAGRQSRDGCLLGRQNSDVGPLTSFSNGGRNDESNFIDHRVSFEITAEEVIRCVEKRRSRMDEASNGRTGETSGSASERGSVDGEDGNRHQKQRSSTLGSVKEFNFDSAAVDGAKCEKGNIIIGPDWWANEKVIERVEDGDSKNWSFFPVIQPGVS